MKKCFYSVKAGIGVFSTGVVRVSRTGFRDAGEGIGDKQFPIEFNLSATQSKKRGASAAPRTNFKDIPRDSRDLREELP